MTKFREGENIKFSIMLSKKCVDKKIMPLSYLC